MHFYAFAFAADQACFAQGFEVLREGGFGDSLVADFEEARTILRAGGAYDIGVNGYADGVGEGMEDGLDGYVFDGGVKERPHGFLFSLLF